MAQLSLNGVGMHVSLPPGLGGSRSNVKILLMAHCLSVEVSHWPGPVVGLGFTACNLNSKSMTHPAPTDHRPWLGMTQLIKFNRESACYSKILGFPRLLG